MKRPAKVRVFASLVILALVALLVVPGGPQTQTKGLVYLQSVTPGTAQSGHVNISGTMTAGQFQGGGAGLTSLLWSNIAGAPAFLTSAAVSPRLAGNATAGSPLDLAQQSATFGQVLKWNGTSWAPGSDVIGGTYSAGTGLLLTGSVFSLDTVYADGRYWNESQGTGGDVSGTLSSLTVTKFQNRPISPTAPAANNVLTWNGTFWAPSTASLALPYSGVVSTALPAFKVTNSGGGAGWFSVTGAATTDATLTSETVGLGAAGSFSVNNTASAANALTAYTNGNGTSQAFFAQHNGLGDCALFSITNSASGGEVVEATSVGSGEVVRAVTTGTGKAGHFQISNTASSATAVYVATNGTGLGLDVVGTARVSVLQIAGGSDLAERFTIGGNAEPGTVVSIDPDNPGELRIADKPYDHCVAGIVSGANGLAAGMVLADITETERSVAVALTGRVWVLCDATTTEIDPGDLLTSSNRRGYAMRATDLDRARGSTIGKAMTRLKRGSVGSVLCLVSLQ